MGRGPALLDREACWERLSWPWLEEESDQRLLVERPHELWAGGGHSVAQLGGERRVQEELDALHRG